MDTGLATLRTFARDLSGWMPAAGCGDSVTSGAGTGEIYLSQQRTIAEKVSCSGIGLHSGVPIQMTLQPARANSGVVLVRRDGAEPVVIPARSDRVTSTSHATTLSEGEVSVATVEHLLAALYALGINNVVVELDGPEVPAMDGSAAFFVRLIRSAGIFAQKEPRAVLCVKRTVEVVDGQRRIRIEPARELRISYLVDFDHPAIGQQEFCAPRLSAAFFERQLAPARTFGFLHEVNALWKAGLAQGGSLENTLVLDSSRVMNSSGLRWPDEFVRHKMLDLLGDLSLLGTAVRGHVLVERGGHSLHHMLVKEVLRTPEAWRVMAGESSLPQGFDLVPLAALPS
jgi:UDP-3-O-[3-hydroxymyristoyl] N-acetylglucosamine deacetylase